MKIVAHRDGLNLGVLRVAEFSALESAWLTLQDGPYMSAFQSRSWYSLINEHIRRSRLSELGVVNRYLLVREGTTPLLILPVRIQLLPHSRSTPPGCYFLGHNTSTDYLDFIYRDLRPDALELAFDFIRDTYKTRHFHFDRILSESPSRAWLQTHVPSQATVQQAIQLSLPTSTAEYSSMLGKQFRQNLRTARNRASRDGFTLSIERCSNLSQADVAQIRHLRSTRRRKAMSELPKISATLGRVYRLVFSGEVDTADALIEQTERWAMAARAPSGRIAAFVAGMWDRRGGVRSLRLHVVTHDPDFSRYSPGLILLHHAICHLIEDFPGQGVLDFTRGVEKYKFDLAGQPHELVSVTGRFPQRGQHRGE